MSSGGSGYGSRAKRAGTLWSRSTTSRPLSAPSIGSSWYLRGYLTDKLGRRGPACFVVFLILAFSYCVHVRNEASPDG